MNVSRGFAATSITIVVNGCVSTASRSFKIRQRDALCLQLGRVRGTMLPELRASFPRVRCAFGVVQRRDDVRRQIRAVVGSGHHEQFEQTRHQVPAIAEVQLHGEKRRRAAIDRLAQTSRSDAPGPSSLDSGAQPVSLRGSRHAGRWIRRFPRIRRDARDGLQLVQIDLVARNGVRASRRSRSA